MVLRQPVFAVEPSSWCVEHRGLDQYENETDVRRTCRSVATLTVISRTCYIHIPTNVLINEAGTVRTPVELVAR